MVTATSGSVQPRGGRRDLQHGARRRGLDSSRGGGRCTSRPLPHRRAPVVRSSPGRFCPTRALASTRSLCMAAPDGSSRPTWPPFNGRRRNADAGAASPRLRLALPRPRSQTGGSDVGVQLPVSGARRRRRHPVPYSPWWSTRPPAWRAPAWTRRTSRPLPRRRAPVVRSSPGRFCPTRALASTRSLCMAAPDGSSRPTWPPFNGRRRNADAGAASPRLRLALPRPRSQTGGSDVGVQ